MGGWKSRERLAPLPLGLDEGTPLPLTPDEVSRRSLAQFEERLRTDEEFRAWQMRRHEGQRSRQLERPIAAWPVKYFLAGQTNPHYRTVKRLAEALGIPVEQLLGPPVHPTFASPLGWNRKAKALRKRLRVART